MCFLSFCICTDARGDQRWDAIAYISEEERKNGARKLEPVVSSLLPASPLESAYIVMIHSKCKVRFLAGQPPPECPPIDEETEVASERAKAMGSVLGNCVELPWRDRNLVGCDDAEFNSWLLLSLKEPSGSINRAKALCCLSTTFMSWQNSPDIFKVSRLMALPQRSDSVTDNDAIVDKCMFFSGADGRFQLQIPPVRSKSLLEEAL